MVVVVNLTMACICIDVVYCLPTAIGGLEEVIRICKRFSNPRMLASLGQVIAAMVPSPEALKVQYSA